MVEVRPHFKLNLLPLPRVRMKSVYLRPMLYKTLSAAVYGIDASIIEVEVDISGVRLPKITFTLSVCPTRPCAKAEIACAQR